MSYNPIVIPLFYPLSYIALPPSILISPESKQGQKEENLRTTRDSGKQLAHSCPSSPSPRFTNETAERPGAGFRTWLVLKFNQQQVGGRQNLDLDLPFNPIVLLSSLSFSPFMFQMAVYVNAYLWEFCGLRFKLEWLQVEILLSLGGGNLEEEVGIHLGLAEFTRCLEKKEWEITLLVLSPLARSQNGCWGPCLAMPWWQDYTWVLGMPWVDEMGLKPVCALDFH